MKTFERMESEVRGYCRTFPTVFNRAQGHLLIAEDGKRYIDFFAGAGALNYGHNDPGIKQQLLDYLSQDGVTHSLDMATSSKRRFLLALEQRILRPRDMSYKVMFPGPTGTNAVEAALKLARKVTGRSTVIAFTNGFHGMTLGSLALTGDAQKRSGAGIPLAHVTHMPFCGYLGTEADTLSIVENYLADGSSGVDAPAAFVVETVQAEGGVNVASRGWLRRLQETARRCGALLIVDDIQVGCGRTGPFFSFEPAGLSPDIVCLSKSLSGYGLPLSIVLMRPELDVWQPGEHNGTFRGHNPAFVTATAALELYWQDERLTRRVQEHAKYMREFLLDVAEPYEAEVRGRGMICGIEFQDAALAQQVSEEAFQRGLIIETAGPRSQTVKLLPPLTITAEALSAGLDILRRSVHSVVKRAKPAASKAKHDPHPRKSIA